jgi:lipopolysaccharide transport system permease protein
MATSGHTILVGKRSESKVTDRRGVFSMTVKIGTVNPHASQPTSLASLFHGLILHRQLISQMCKREVIGRYKGSMLGLLWSFFNPVFMLIVYTFVFSEIFKSKWGGGSSNGSKTEFAVVLFVGMIVQTLFSEMLNRAPSLILSNVNYVKKVVFPLEILTIVALGSTLFHSLISMTVLLLAFVVFNGYLQWTVIFIPFVLIPIIILTAGLSWILSALGVFLRDIGQTIVIITTVLMFMAPVFYPITAVPESFRPIIMANPLTFIIEQAREVLIWGHPPNWRGLAIYTVLATSIAWAGYVFFQKTRKGFADVL